MKPRPKFLHELCGIIAINAKVAYERGIHRHAVLRNADLLGDEGDDLVWQVIAHFLLSLQVTQPNAERSQSVVEGEWNQAEDDQIARYDPQCAVGETFLRLRPQAHCSSLLYKSALRQTV
jgi:hypothetical protein